MRVAAIYDIHGNLPALEAVLEEIHRIGVDHVVVGGDVLPGPMPCESFACLLDLDIPMQFIMGNGDRVVLEQMAGVTADNLPEQARQAIRWTAEQLDADHEALIRSWPKTHCLKIAGIGEVFFCHATPRNDTEIFTRLTPDDRLLPIFTGLKAAVVVCGHTHMQFDRAIGNVRVVNAGSVGMPFGEPGAYWLLLGPGIELRHTAYDLTTAAERIRNTSYPQAQEFAAREILRPSSEEEMLNLFSRAELKR